MELSELFSRQRAGDITLTIEHREGIVPRARFKYGICRILARFKLSLPFFHPHESPPLYGLNLGDASNAECLFKTEKFSASQVDNGKRTFCEINMFKVDFVTTST